MRGSTKYEVRRNCKGTHTQAGCLFVVGAKEQRSYAAPCYDALPCLDAMIRNAQPRAPAWSSRYSRLLHGTHGKGRLCWSESLCSSFALRPFSSRQCDCTWANSIYFCVRARRPVDIGCGVESNDCEGTCVCAPRNRLLGRLRLFENLPAGDPQKCFRSTRRAYCSWR